MVVKGRGDFLREAHFDQGDTKKSLAVKPNQEFHIKIADFTTTGYQWFMQSFPEDLVGWFKTHVRRTCDKRQSDSVPKWHCPCKGREHEE